MISEGRTVPYKPVIDLDQLLAPIAGDNPSGASLLYEGLHDNIREARRSDDLLAQGEWKRDPKVADWHQVVTLATDALSTQTKDLQVAAWLAEALVELHGFPGLHDGLRLMRGLLESFWDTMYPEIDEGDMEARANAIDMFNRPEFVVCIHKIALTNQSLGFKYSYLDYKDSARFVIPENLEALSYEDRERAQEKKSTAEAEGKITSNQWRVAVNAGNRAFYEDLYAMITQCWNETESLDRVMDEKFQRQTPGLSTCKKGLDEVRALADRTVKEKRILEPDEVELEPGAAAGDAAPAGAAGAIGAGAVRSRQEALKRLGEVAAYFRATEPHSPVSYLLQRCINWGNMTLESWLEDVVKDVSVLGRLQETLGIKSKEGS
ncbi:MAG: type VI secretion system protein TssA [Acidobacteria bacterium]|nr:type VI secretion system protein TssA [Acidobacteriota bacterium]